MQLMKHQLIEIERIIISPYSYKDQKDSTKEYKKCNCLVYFNVQKEEYRRALIRFVNSNFIPETWDNFGSIFLKNDANYSFGGLGINFEKGHTHGEDEKVSFKFDVYINVESTKIGEIMHAAQRLEDYFVKSGCDEKKWYNE